MNSNASHNTALYLKKSCLTNLLEHLEFVSKHADKGFTCGCYIFRFKKAFDKIPHGRLMSKVGDSGFGGRVYN